MEKLLGQIKALSDMTRLKILKFLLHREHCVCEIAELIGISQPGVSQHLRKLRAAGFVTERRDSQWVYYRGNHQALEEFISGLQEFMARDLRDILEMQSEVERMQHLDESPAVAACKRPKASAS